MARVLDTVNKLVRWRNSQATVQVPDDGLSGNPVSDDESYSAAPTQAELEIMSLEVDGKKVPDELRRKAEESKPQPKEEKKSTDTDRLGELEKKCQALALAISQIVSTGEIIEEADEAAAEPTDQDQQPKAKQYDTGVAEAKAMAMLGNEEFRPELLPDDSDDSDVGFWAKITGNAADGANRWKYAWSEVEKTVAGYGGWTVLADGRTGTTAASPARNTIEDINNDTAETVLGNGVTVSSLDTAEATFTLKACTTSNIVKMHEVVVVGGTPEYWFSYENGVDGSCDA